MYGDTEPTEGRPVVQRTCRMLMNDDHSKISTSIETVVKRGISFVPKWRSVWHIPRNLLSTYLLAFPGQDKSDLAETVNNILSTERPTVLLFDELSNDAISFIKLIDISAIEKGNTSSDSNDISRHEHVNKTIHSASVTGDFCPGMTVNKLLIGNDDVESSVINNHFHLYIGFFDCGRFTTQQKIFDAIHLSPHHREKFSFVRMIYSEDCASLGVDAQSDFMCGVILSLTAFYATNERDNFITALDDMERISKGNATIVFLFEKMQFDYQHENKTMVSGHKTISIFDQIEDPTRVPKLAGFAEQFYNLVSFKTGTKMVRTRYDTKSHPLFKKRFQSKKTVAAIRFLF